MCHSELFGISEDDSSEFDHSEDAENCELESRRLVTLANSY